jgi:hypothetical protein
VRKIEKKSQKLIKSAKSLDSVPKGVEVWGNLPKAGKLCLKPEYKNLSVELKKLRELY